MPALVTVVAVLLGGALLGIVGALVAITAAHGPCAARRRRALPRLDHARTPTVLGPLTCGAAITGRPQPVWVSLASAHPPPRRVPEEGNANGSRGQGQQQGRRAQG